MTAQMVWNKDAIIQLLDTNDKAVDRAVVQLYRRQTQEEQATHATKVNNGVGFTGLDAEFLSSLAESAMKYGQLTPKQRAIARTRVKKYWRQLLSIVQARFGPDTVSFKVPKARGG